MKKLFVLAAFAMFGLVNEEVGVNGSYEYSNESTIDGSYEYASGEVVPNGSYEYA